VDNNGGALRKPDSCGGAWQAPRLLIHSKIQKGPHEYKSISVAKAIKSCHHVISTNLGSLNAFDLNSNVGLTFLLVLS
jgi:hypothetical protein